MRWWTVSGRFPSLEHSTDPGTDSGMDPGTEHGTELGTGRVADERARTVRAGALRVLPWHTRPQCSADNYFVTLPNS
ncbi:hypothetical protein GCM10022384_65110 [Streptomyces marokkonensis]|uniref:Uncharacterized protein n=1 Tax=Streptomyces marokkonensis TaxID=324855 RepID=A0ABP7SF83_9ACTN